jgi:LytS/YehU family sensor histidine kinase
LEVSNSGKWIEKNSQGNDGTGTGLKNIKERLENAFPENHIFEIKKNENHVKVVIKINSKRN